MQFSHNGRPSVRDQKNALRTVMREKRRALSLEKRKELDLEICKKLLSLTAYRYADTVLSYSPLSGEVDITEFNRAVLESGKRLALPRCIHGQPIMNFHYVNSLEELAEGSWSIKEPSADSEMWREGNGSAVCIIPGMSFDLDGYRLGYGKGYYDRFLSGKTVTKIGVVYSEFVRKTVPRGRFDLSVDMVVTEKAVNSVGK